MWVDVVLVQDDVLYRLVDVAVVLDLVKVRRDRHQGRPEAYGQVVRVHHVLVTILGETAGKVGHSVVLLRNISFMAPRIKMIVTLNSL